MKKIKLPEELEVNLLQAIRLGICSPEVVQQEELSKKSQAIYVAIKHLLSKRVPVPLKVSSIQLTASSLLGVPKGAVTSYLKDIDSTDPGPEIKQILRAARDKITLVSLLNEAGGQLASGDLKLSSLSSIISRGAQTGEALKSFATEVDDGFPEPPVGLPLKSLPVIGDVCNGLFGVWVIGGEPGLGKSTLGFQIAIDVADEHEVVYYDLDGTGRAYILDRSRHIFGDNVKAFKKATKNLYFRPSIHTLESDLSAIKAPALLVIDSVQTLPGSIRYQKQTLDDWIRRFKDLTKDGYVFLLVSEKQRAEYGEANIAGFKGTGDIEYGGTMCAQLLQHPDEDDVVQFHIVKSRHGKKKGYITDLERDEKRVFWFKEVGKA